MKYIPSIAFEEMSGSAKGVTAAKSRGRKYIRNKGTGSSVRTSSQASVKSIFSQLSQSWKNLTNEQILAWTNLATSQAGKSVLGTTSKITGSNLYMRLNYWIVASGGTALSDVPSLRGVESPSEATISLTSSAFTFALDEAPTNNPDDLKLIIMASAPQSNGVSSAYSKAVIIGDGKDAATTVYDILEDFTAKHGEVSDALPKVFLKWFFVDTTTGECSGNQMGVAILESDESGE